jgi:hypothetical protein
MKRKTREGIVRPEAPPLGYARVEAALARIYRAEDVQQTTFRARLKHLRKLGVPSQNPGKGAPLAYSMQDVFRLMVCLELAEFGIAPALVVKIVKRHWAGKGYFPQAIQNAQLFPGNDFLAVIQTDFMSWPWNRKKFKQDDTGIFFSSGMLDPVQIAFPKESDAAVIFKDLREAGRRACVFNLSARIRALKKALKESVP